MPRRRVDFKLKTDASEEALEAGAELVFDGGAVVVGLAEAAVVVVSKDEDVADDVAGPDDDKVSEAKPEVVSEVDFEVESEESSMRLPLFCFFPWL